MVPYVKNVKGGELTYEFLTALSNHLSTRQSCKRIEYEVFIGVVCDSHNSDPTVDKVSNVVMFWPREEVYPDRFHKRVNDKQLLVNHVMEYHFKDTIFDHYNNGMACYKADSLVPGIYKYALSVSGKQRRWIQRQD